MSNRICVSDTEAVSEEVCRLYQHCFPQASVAKLKQAFVDFRRLFMGEYPGFHAAETPYHDLQHSLDVTLAMTRILIAYHDSNSHQLKSDMVELGIIIALFHDAGYVRQYGDDAVSHGAAYTKVHVSRSADFLAHYLPELGLEKQVVHAVQLVHFTGYEVRVADIPVASEQYKMIGFMLGSADLMAQMADRCYLEKCRDRLYDEFVFAGLAKPEKDHDDYDHYIFHCRDDILTNTPVFMQTAIEERLEITLGGVHRYLASFFGGNHLYLHHVEKNRTYLEAELKTRGGKPLLRRNAPWTLA